MRRPAARRALDDLFLMGRNASDPVAAVRRAVFQSVAAMGFAADQLAQPQAESDQEKFHAEM
jgi:hypothetical protein